MSGQRVGVVGNEQLAGAVESAGGTAVVDGASVLETVEFAVATGVDAVLEIVRSTVEVPVLIVGSVDGLASVPADRAGAAIERAVRGTTETESHPVIGVSGPEGGSIGIFDVALMAAEPARISEFSVGGVDGRIAQFRADGVVASTPAGSHGYNRRAGGPIVAAGTGVASIVPIAPFSTSAGHWVSPIDAVELAIERDETPVELLVDGRRERVIDTDESIELSIVGALETYTFPDLVSPRGGEKPLSP